MYIYINKTYRWILMTWCFIRRLWWLAFSQLILDDLAVSSDLCSSSQDAIDPIVQCKYNDISLVIVPFHERLSLNKIVSNTDAYVPFIQIVWFPMSEVILLSWCNWCGFVSYMDFFRPFWAQFSRHQFYSTVFVFRMPCGD